MRPPAGAIQCSSMRAPRALVAVQAPVEEPRGPVVKTDDVAPTMLELMGLPVPAAMTGKSLLVRA